MKHIITESTPIVVDIHKVIDDAMEKKDRSVCIHINGDNASVYVEPLEKRDPRWILREIRTPEKYRIRKYNYECSECHVCSDAITPYCGFCGEKLRMPCEEDNHKEAETDGDDSTGKTEA